MQRTDALQDLLADMTGVFNDGERLPVEFDKSSYARPDGTVVVAPNVRDALGKSLSGPDELRVVIDTLSHEVEHVRESVLTGKREFMAEFPDYPAVAGAVINIVEDQFIDYNRGRRFKGTRRTQAFVTDAIMSNGHRRPPLTSLDRKEQQLVEGLMQVAFAGYAKGIGEVDDDVQQYLAYARGRVNEARRERDPAKREAIARDLTERMLDLFPPKPTIDIDALEELIEQLRTDEVGEGIPPAPEGDEGDGADAESAQDDADDDPTASGGEGSAASSGDGDSDLTVEVDELLGEYDRDALVIVD